MKQFLLTMALLAAPLFGQAQQMEQFKLWPDEPKKSEAELFVFHPEGEATAAPAVLICPGGGYEMLAMDHEGKDMARWYAENGFVAVVLKYRMPRGDRSIPLSDAERAISFIRENAATWHVDGDRVGVVGSSAGGHLAASLSTLAADANRPDFAILYYPVISFEEGTTHPGSKKNLLGKEVDNPRLVEHFTLQKQVDERTPKTILLLSDDDTVVPPLNSILYYRALNERHIPASLYIFPNGGHGWGFRSDFTYHEEMKTLIMKWLAYHHLLPGSEEKGQ